MEANRVCFWHGIQFDINGLSLFLHLSKDIYEHDIYITIDKQITKFPKHSAHRFRTPWFLFKYWATVTSRLLYIYTLAQKAKRKRSIKCRTKTENRRMSSHLARIAGQWNRRHRHICWVRCSAHHSGSHSHTPLHETEGKTVMTHTCPLSFLSFLHSQTLLGFKWLHLLIIYITNRHRPCIFLFQTYVEVGIDDISPQAKNTNSTRFMPHILQWAKHST